MMPKEDKYTRSKLELKADLAMAFGGRAAEELIFDDVTTGAAGDIQQMTATARRMVCIYGMSDILGPVKLGDYTNHPHLRIDGPPPEGISNETEREIDLEVRKIIADACAEARNCLKEHRDQLETLAEKLLEAETLAIDEIYPLLGMETPEEPIEKSDVPEPITLYPDPEPEQTPSEDPEESKKNSADDENEHAN